MKEKFPKKVTGSSERGFIALTSVLVLSGVFIVLFMGMFFSATEEMEKVTNESEAIKALSLANSCIEVGLNELKNNSNYTGGENVQVDENDCEIKPVEDEEDVKILKGEGEINERIKRIEVVVDISNHPEIKIIDWKEVSSFN